MHMSLHLWKFILEGAVFFCIFDIYFYSFWLCRGSDWSWICVLLECSQSGSISDKYMYLLIECLLKYIYQGMISSVIQQDSSMPAVWIFGIHLQVSSVLFWGSLAVWVADVKERSFGVSLKLKLGSAYVIHWEALRGLRTHGLPSSRMAKVVSFLLRSWCF